MKAVLLSIQPKWFQLIASGKKTVEVRKTKPKLEAPFKCYIYETQGKAEIPFVDEEGQNIFKGRGQVIGEFVCNRLTYIEAGYDTNGNKHLYNTAFIEHRMCIPDNDLHEYLYKDRDHCGGWAWFISDLVIYDQPKELREFIVPSNVGCCNEGKCRGCRWFDEGNGFNVEDDCNAPFCTDEYKPLRKAPQSWCYVEEVNQ